MTCAFPFCFSPVQHLGTVDLVPFPACQTHSSLLHTPTRPLLPSSLVDSLLDASPRPSSQTTALQLEEQGLFEEAAGCWSQCLAQCEATDLKAEAAYHLGYLLTVFLEHAEEGIEYLRSAMNLEGSGEARIRAANLLAQNLMDQAQEEEARDMLRELIASNPATTPATIRSELLLGAAYFLLYDEVRAEYHLLKAVDATQLFPNSEIALEACTFVALMRESVLFAERAEWVLEQFTGNCENFLLTLHFFLLHSHSGYSKDSRWGRMLQTFASLLARWNSPLALQVRLWLDLCCQPKLVVNVARDRALSGEWNLVKARNLLLYASILPSTDEEAYQSVQEALGLYQRLGLHRISVLHYFFLVKPLCLSLPSALPFFEAVLSLQRVRNPHSSSTVLAFEVLLHMSAPSQLQDLILTSLTGAQAHIPTFCKMLQAVNRFFRKQDSKLLHRLMPSLSQTFAELLKGASPPTEASAELMLTVSGMMEGWMSSLLLRRALGMYEAMNDSSINTIRCKQRLAVAVKDADILKQALESCQGLHPGAHFSLQLVSILAEQGQAEQVLLDNIAYIRQHCQGAHYLAEAIMQYLGSQEAYRSYTAQPSLARYSETYEPLYTEAAQLYLSLSPKSSFALAVLTDYVGMCQDFPERLQQLQDTAQRLFALHRHIDPSSEAHEVLLRQWALKNHSSQAYRANVLALKEEKARSEDIVKALCWLANALLPAERILVLREAAELELKGEGYEALLLTAVEEHRQGREEAVTELRTEAIRRAAGKKLALLLCEERRFAEAEEIWLKGLHGRIYCS